VILLNAVVTILVSASLNELLGMVNAYQLILMMPLLMVTLPPNAGMYFAQLMTIAAFEVFDTKPFLDRLLRLEPTDPVNSNYEAVGLESLYFLHNMGTLVLAFVFFMLEAAVSLLCRSSSHRKIKEFGDKLHKQLFWGSFITLVTEAYSMLTISCMINLRFLSWGSFSIGMMSVFAILTTLFLIAFPAYLGWLLKTNFQNLELKSFK